MNNETKGIQKRNAEYAIMANRKRKLDQWISDYWYERYTRYIRTDRLFWETPELNLSKQQLNLTMKDYAQSGVPWPLTTYNCLTDYLITQVRGGLAIALCEWNQLDLDAKENLVVYFVRQYKKKFYTEVTGKVMPGGKEPKKAELLTFDILNEFFFSHGITDWECEIRAPKLTQYLDSETIRKFKK